MLRDNIDKLAVGKMGQNTKMLLKVINPTDKHLN